ncbi:non-hydrolyzing UDP-N-acetylglucosamine 2-epimerase [Paradesertivirga mongoliensis]|uniref:Non-hydrolyzing UDP-N-acetylglucosamine 2-epimerase n=1 Tax=Paradesertivirga mongoliensis TaxID=2100740 RepID=A0ABW4ZJ15_9SPHI|nr:UDP-N-acetylglucosamine 2-epimerase (non-hydrolyzing) [Pedobacter mongoliensis]
MKICTIIGARPQFIKAAVVSRAISEVEGLTEVLIHTGQHFDANMSDVFFTELDIPVPDYNLKIGGGTHGENTGRMIESIEKVLIDEKPDHVLVYGDTDSTLAGALAAAKLHIPIAHVEAGLRSFNRKMPEEINRVLTDHAASLLFAPTETAVENLVNEGIAADKISQVGDVMFDATLYYGEKTRRPQLSDIRDEFIMCTIHRAENTNDQQKLRAIISALNEISETTQIVLPLHPRTAGIIKAMGDVKLGDSIKVIDPVGFLEMHWLLQNCLMVMTDSGGVQKEAFFHKKPCVTLRDETEWVELVHSGVNRLAAPGRVDIPDVVAGMAKLKISPALNLYGDGNAGKKIVKIIKDKVI